MNQNLVETNIEMSKEAESKTQDQCDMSVSSNSKSHHYHDNQKIEEINNKLGSYINLVRPFYTSYISIVQLSN